MAAIGSGLGVVEYGLIRDVDIEDLLHDVGGFAGRDGEGDVEGQDEAEDILRVMDPVNIDERFIGPWMNKLGGLE